MKLKPRGKSTSAVEVVNISPFGLWVHHERREYFLDHDKFPWFRDAKLRDVLHVVAESESHLRWPELDVDLHIESLQRPVDYPLVSRLPAKTRTRRARRSAAARTAASRHV